MAGGDMGRGRTFIRLIWRRGPALSTAARVWRPRKSGPDSAGESRGEPAPRGGASTLCLPRGRFME